MEDENRWKGLEIHPAQVGAVRRMLLGRYVPNRDREGSEGFHHGRKRENMGGSDLDVDLERSLGCDNECVELT